MKVSLPVLQHVYQILKEKGERNESGIDELLNPENHLFFIDAYEMPRWNWSQTRSTFEKYVIELVLIVAHLVLSVNKSSQRVDHLGFCRVTNHCNARSI